jgi:hypothetical protein
MANDDSAKAARLIKVAEAVVDELHRQGFSEVLADRRFDPVEIAKAVIKAADGEVVPIRRS